MGGQRTKTVRTKQNRDRHSRGNDHHSAATEWRPRAYSIYLTLTRAGSMRERTFNLLEVGGGVVGIFQVNMTAGEGDEQSSKNSIKGQKEKTIRERMKWRMKEWRDEMGARQFGSIRCLLALSHRYWMVKRSIKKNAADPHDPTNHRQGMLERESMCDRSRKRRCGRNRRKPVPCPYRQRTNKLRWPQYPKETKSDLAK